MKPRRYVIWLKNGQYLAAGRSHKVATSELEEAKRFDCAQDAQREIDRWRLIGAAPVIVGTPPLPVRK